MDSSRQPGMYTIRVRGHLEQQWAARFEGMTIIHTEAGDTLLTGPVVDQAALHGLLRTIQDMGLELLAVNLIDTG